MQFCYVFNLEGVSYDYVFSVWNYQEVRKALPSAVYVSLLRDPVDCFESNYVYMGLQNIFKMDINQFAQEKVRIFPRALLF